MWEFEIVHNSTEEIKLIFGYSLSDAFRRHNIESPNEWECIRQEYID